MRGLADATVSVSRLWVTWNESKLKPFLRKVPSVFSLETIHLV